MSDKKKTFEEALGRLEEIVGKLEDQRIPLQDGFALYEEGMKLAASLRQELTGIEKKVKILQKNAAGTYEESDFLEEKREDD